MKIRASVPVVAAVSGGVDSVVMLHRLYASGDNVVVAHFDHGIRSDSDADARFVEALARQYGLKFRCKREELGPGASEALARERRYTFLGEVAQEYGATAIATAHHLDDLVETVSINLVRGTGWRGLSVLDSEGIVRPLLEHTKAQLYEYALAHSLEWVEDETNSTGLYLRNRIRGRLELDGAERLGVADLRHKQCQVKRKIDDEQGRLLQGMGDDYSRYFFTMIDEASAIELLRTVLLMRCGNGLTIPQRRRLWYAIKLSAAGSVFQAGGGVAVRFSRASFTVQTA